MRAHMRARASRSPVGRSLARSPVRTQAPYPGHIDLVRTLPDTHRVDLVPGPGRTLAVHPSHKNTDVHRSEDLLLAAEAGATVPVGMKRCIVTGGGFSGNGAEEYGLMRVITAGPERNAEEQHAMACSIYPYGEVGILRLPKSPPAEVLEEIPRVDWKKRMAEEAEAQRRAYQEEIEKRLRLILEEQERKRFAENSEKLAGLFTSMGDKHATIQEEKREQRRHEVALAKFELEKHEIRRRLVAATTIQSWWRMLLPRRMYRIMLQAHRKMLMQKRLHEHMKRRRNRAATDIQRLYRGRVCRARYRELRRMNREDWLSQKLRRHLRWIIEDACLKKKENPKRKKNMVIYSVRAAVRVQAWYRGWKVRQDVKRAKLLRMNVEADEASTIGYLRRIRREAEHANAELTGHKDMSMVTHAAKRRDIEDAERLTRDLRKVREAARAVEADLDAELHEAELKVVPFKELSAFLDAKQVRAERDEARLERDKNRIEMDWQGAAAMELATIRERDLQDNLDMKNVRLGLGQLREEAKKIQRNMVELQSGTSAFSRLNEFRRELDILAF